MSERNERQHGGERCQDDRTSALDGGFDHGIERRQLILLVVADLTDQDQRVAHQNSRLVRFIDDGRIPLDTNQLERGMRAFGRKNHYGSRSERGTQVAALFYSLFETAKLVGVEPAAYIAEATRRAIDNPGTVTLPRDLVSS